VQLGVNIYFHGKKTVGKTIRDKQSENQREMSLVEEGNMEPPTV